MHHLCKVRDGLVVGRPASNEEVAVASTSCKRDVDVVSVHSDTGHETGSAFDTSLSERVDIIGITHDGQRTELSRRPGILAFRLDDHNNLAPRNEGLGNRSTNAAEPAHDEMTLDAGDLLPNRRSSQTSDRAERSRTAWTTEPTRAR